MTPRFAAHILGLCNVCAGALVFGAPALLLGDLAGVASPAAHLLGTSLAVLLTATGVGAWLIPPAATRAYLWLFGVAVKTVGGLAWGVAALATGAPILMSGAVVDLAVAASITLSLRRR